MSPGSQRIVERRNSPGRQPQPSKTSPNAQQPFLLRMEQQLYSPGSSRGGAPPSAGGPAPAADAVRSSRNGTAGALSSASAGKRASLDPVSKFPFRPIITDRAARRKPSSLNELSDGERLRRERKLAQARAAAETRELEGVTFRPQMSAATARGQYAEVKPKLLEARTAPEVYLAGIAEKQRRLEDQRVWAEREKEVSFVVLGDGKGRG